MSNARTLWQDRFVAIFALLAGIGIAQPVLAQTTQWQAAQPSPAPMQRWSAVEFPASRPAMSEYANSARQAPLARLIENPDQTDGAPPFALTDQTGTIQRYVEPVPGIDLAANIGQIVVVRNDTGPILLASQLELPRQSLHPLVGESVGGASGYSGGRSFASPRRMASSTGVQQVQYVDDDDSTVQLLPDEMGLPDGSSGGAGGVRPLETLGSGGEFGGFPGQMMPDGTSGPGCDPQFGGPMQYGPGMMQANPGPMAEPFPQYGGPGHGTNDGYGAAAGGSESQRTHLYGDVEFNFFRTRFSEDALGKPSEAYEFSPRFVLGVQNLGNLDARVRYWHYGRDPEVLGNGDIRLEFDVLDLELLHRFEGRKSQLALAAGVRLAHLQLKDDADAKSSSDMLGLTMAADGLTPFHSSSAGYFGWVYGGRVSLLGGDWGGDPGSEFVDHQVRDDNVLVTEFYAGAEVSRRWRNLNLQGAPSSKFKTGGATCWPATPTSNRSASSAPGCKLAPNSKSPRTLAGECGGTPQR